MHSFALYFKGKFSSTQASCKEFFVFFFPVLRSDKLWNKFNLVGLEWTWHCNYVFFLFLLFFKSCELKRDWYFECVVFMYMQLLPFHAMQSTCLYVLIRIF